MCVVFTLSANAMNVTADMLRSCERVRFVGTADSYVLKCAPSEKINKLMNNNANIPRFFVSDNNGDTRGTFLSEIPENTDFIYVNVASNLPDARYENQTCYRFITEIDRLRDGFYAVEVCEYERPDYYL